jgi:hypothetical protein
MLTAGGMDIVSKQFHYISATGYNSFLVNRSTAHTDGDLHGAPRFRRRKPEHPAARRSFARGIRETLADQAEAAAPAGRLRACSGARADVIRYLSCQQSAKGAS